MAGVAYAVVHADPPEVYLATDVDVLARVLALEVVARTDVARLRTPGAVEAIRQALLDERWADALLDWIDITGMAVDVYTHLHVYTDADLPAGLIGAQLQFTPLFGNAAAIADPGHPSPGSEPPGGSGPPGGSAAAAGSEPPGGSAPAAGSAAAAVSVPGTGRCGRTA